MMRRRNSKMSDQNETPKGIIQENIIVFMDSLQRTIIAEMIPDESNETELMVRNAVVVNIIQQQDPQGRPMNQMALQLIPLFFREFLAEKSEDTYYKYNRSMITEIKRFEHGFDFRLYAQYEALFKPQPQIAVPQGAGQVQPATPGEANKIVNLFGDK